MRRTWRWTFAATAVAAMALGAADARGDAKRLLGTVRATGQVESALPGQDWRPLTGGAVIEGMRLRTGADGMAVVQLSDGDVLGLAEASTCELPVGGDGHVRLIDGRLALRLRAESGLVVDAAAASVRPPAVNPVALGQREALVTLDRGTATVRPYHGTFEVSGPGEGVIQVAAGQEATVAPQAKSPVVAAATTPPDTDAKKAAEGGGVLAALGIPPTIAEIIGGGAAVVGGAVGGAAAAGAFSGGDGGSTDTGGAQGSPFRPIRR